MEKSSFFNAVLHGDTWDRTYLAEDFAGYFASFIGNGVFPNPSTSLQIISTNSYNITVKQGKGWINGYYYQNTDNYNLQLDVADGVLDRIDRIVLCLDFQARAINLNVKKGTFASSPVPQTIQRDADRYEIALADIKITHGAIGINQADITDLRLNKELCGIVCAVVENVDTTSIFNQYETWLKNCENQEKQWFSIFTSQSKEEFEAWFETIKNILGTDEAGKILDKLLELKTRYEKSLGDIDNIKQQQLEFLTQQDLENKSTELDCGYWFDTLKDNSKITTDFYCRHNNKANLIGDILTDNAIWNPYNIGFQTNRITYYHKRSKSTETIMSSINEDKRKINVYLSNIKMEVI